MEAQAVKPHHGRRCATCSHPELVTIQRLMAQGVPYSELSATYGLAKSSISRHAKNHMGRAKKREGVGSYKPRTQRAQKIRSDSGRCGSCGQITGDGEALEPTALVRRAERLLNIAENIATRAEADNDNRLCLFALDRAQRSLDSLLKVAGLLGPDVQVNVDNRQQNLYAHWPTESLSAAQTFHDALNNGKGVSEAVEAVLSAQKRPALPKPHDNNEAA